MQGEPHRTMRIVNQRRCIMPLLLPALYVGLVLATAIFAKGTDGTPYDRLVGVDPIGLAVRMIYANPVVVMACFLVTGAPWWYFIGRMCCDGRDGKLGRITSVLGSVLAFFTVGTIAKLTGDALREDISSGILSKLATFQYCIAGLLGIGALISAFILLRVIFARAPGAPV